MAQYLSDEDDAVVIIGSPTDIDEVELSGPTVKVFHEKVAGDKFYLLGWKKSVKGHRPIMAKHVIPIGKVVNIYPTLDRRSKRIWKWIERE